MENGYLSPLSSKPCLLSRAKEGVFSKAMLARILEVEHGLFIGCGRHAVLSRILVEETEPSMNFCQLRARREGVLRRSLRRNTIKGAMTVQS